MENNSYKSGFVGIIGPPNAGKSTLLNRLLGEKIAIVSPKPQTTRNRLLGVLHGTDFQIVFVDTPGIHKTKTVLHKSMVSSAGELDNEVDIILLLLDITYSHDENIDTILNSLRKTKKPVILAINKIDIPAKQEILPVIERFSKEYDFKAIVPISALTGDGIEGLLQEIKALMAPGPEFYPPDMKTDQSNTFLISEIIREKIYLSTKREIPYSSAVTVEGIKEDKKKDLISIFATIHVESESQKGIIIGKNGSMIKQIGSSARIELEKTFHCHVFLNLKARVEKNWTKDAKALRKLGY